MHKRSEVVRFEWELFGRSLDPVALADAAGLGCEGLLPFPCAQMFDDAVGKDDVEALLRVRQPGAVADNGDVIGLQERTFKVIQRSDVQDSDLGFDRDTLPRPWQATDIQDAHRTGRRKSLKKLSKAASAEVWGDFPRDFEYRVHILEPFFSLRWFAASRLLNPPPPSTPLCIGGIRYTPSCSAINQRDRVNGEADVRQPTVVKLGLSGLGTTYLA
jgi:hypothetical protein